MRAIRPAFWRSFRISISPNCARSIPRRWPKPKPKPANRLLPFQSADIVYNGQAIAVVVADTYERARDAATLVKANIETRPPSTTLRDTPNIDTP